MPILSMRLLSLLALIFILPPFTAMSRSQVSSAPGSSADLLNATLPGDSKALLDLAMQTNGLLSPQLKPWHMKVTFHTFDEKGSSQIDGTFEQWWMGPNKWKSTLNSGSFTQTMYQVDGLHARSGTAGALPYPTETLIHEFADDMPHNSQLEDVRIVQKRITLGPAKLPCLVLAPEKPKDQSWPDGLFATYCFDPAKPILRARFQAGGEQVVMTRIGTFQNRYVGLGITAFCDGKRCGNADVVTLETLAKVDDKFFVPPADAVSVNSEKVVVSHSVMQGFKLTGPNPVYPAEAKHRGIQGTVVLHTIIGRDGRMHSVGIISGPSDLYVSAVAAVEQWKYKPYLLNGTPVEVDTTVNVVFQLRP